jgi:hypothetical protein
MFRFTGRLAVLQAACDALPAVAVTTATSACPTSAAAGV